MAKSLDFFQIYYQEEQKEFLYDFATPFLNQTLTPYFENSVIAALAPQSNADLISVCSWRLRKKREDRSMQLKGKTDLSLEKIINEDFDVAVLTPVSKSHKVLVNASLWHGETWDISINKLKDFINVPCELLYPIYENHFVATKEVYHEYVSDCLIPAFDFIRKHECFFSDSNYAKRKTEDERKRYTAITGRQDWPIAPFILERLFSIWINDRKLKIINL